MPSKTNPLPPEAEQPKVEAAAKPESGIAAAPAATSPAAATTGKKILIVEDERPLAHALEMKFRNQGYETQVVMNGVEALAAVKTGGFGMVLLDLIMPVMDGFAVLAELKSQGNKIPVIVLSNLGQDEDRAKTKELGAIDYFVKSNTPIAEIVTRVKSVL